MTEEYELTSQHNKKRKFFGSAKVRTEKNKIILNSCNIDVAYIEKGKATVESKYSLTALKHIKEFLRQHGFFAYSWRQIKRDYMKEDKK